MSNKYIKSMIIRLIEMIRKKAMQIYFGLLFALLIYIYFPSFSHPPRSDHWPALYFFYRIDALVGMHKWPYIFTYDPLIKITFRPLSFLLPYFEHVVFGSNFVYVQIITFFLYFTSILLLYKLAKFFCKNRLLVAFFIGAFAILFSHFDLVCWSFQSHIILAFCLFLFGFCLFINYMKSNCKLTLVFIILLFLMAVFLYEVFLLWPLAIIILVHIKELPRKEQSKKKVNLSASYVLVFFYTLYFLFLFLNRKAISVYSESQISFSPLFSFSSFISNFFLVFFNIAYNNFLVNLMPPIAYPLITNDNNLNMGGFITEGGFNIDKLIFFGGSIVIILLSIMIFYLFRKRQVENIKIFTFFMFLLFSELFTLFFLKSLVNDNLYNLTQFRYQYVPNALFILIVLFLIEKLLKPVRRNKIIICFVLIFVVITNILSIKRGLSILNTQLTPLQSLLTNIKKGINLGKINREDKIYLDNKIAEKLPSLCWNKEMGRRCMRGTYQWLFSKEEIKYFSTLEDAKWVIDENDLSIVRK